MRRYRHYQPEIADACLASCERHLWYVTPQLIVFCLVDPQVPITEKEDIVKVLFDISRPAKQKTGKPTFPEIAWPEDHPLPKLSSLVSSQSWTLFDLLGLHGAQEWMQTPVNVWEMFSDYRKLKTYVWNDLAKRGIKLTSDFLHLCRDEEQLQALLQCVEQHRVLYPSYTKKVFARLNS